MSQGDETSSLEFRASHAPGSQRPTFSTNSHSLPPTTTNCFCSISVELIRSNYLLPSTLTSMLHEVNQNDKHCAVQ